MRNALLEFGPLSQGRGPLYPRRAAPAVRIARPRQQQEQEEDQQQPLQQPVQQPVQAVAPPVAEPPAPAEQDDTGLVGKIADGALTAVGALGNVLDLPGSSVRDILQGKNPFDQWLDPLSHAEKGTSSTGRDLLETYGMRKNKETGWVPLEDPGEFARDAAGFAAELALDPLGWMTGWMSSAAGKGARGTKALAAAADTAKAVKQPGVVRRAAGKMGDAFDAVDPGHQLGRAVHRNPTTRKWVQDAGKGVQGTVGAGIRRASKYARGANRWADQVDPFPSGGERQRFSKEARRTFGEEADEFMPVMDARARTWAKEAAERSPDEYFKDLSTKQSDIDNLPDEALRQGDPRKADGSQWFTPEAWKSAESGTGYKSREKIIMMSIDDFLQMAEKLESPVPDKIKTVREVLQKGSKFNHLPILTFKAGKDGLAKVSGHEGRHRAIALKEIGIEAIPVLFTSAGANEIRWSQQSNVDDFDRIQGIWPKRLQGQKNSIEIEFPVPDPANPAAIETPEFKEWFGDSKIVDEGGKPLRVYHGTGTPDLGKEAREANQADAFARSEWDTWSEAEKTGRPLSRDALVQFRASRESFGDAIIEATGLRGDKYSVQDGMRYNFSTPQSAAESIYKGADRRQQERLWREGFYSKWNGGIETSLTEASLDKLRLAQKVYDDANAYYRGINPKPKVDKPLRSKPRDEGQIFNTARYGANDEGWYAAGTYFSDNAEEASEYAATAAAASGGQAGVIPVYLNMRKPFIQGVTNDPEALRLIDEAIEVKRSTVRAAGGDVSEYARAAAEGTTEGLKKAGYDGMIVPSTKLGTDLKPLGNKEYIAFDPTQIKSVNNRGTFDPSNPNIYHQAGGEAGTAARGAVVFKDSKRVIHAFKSADISTLAHESAHVFRRDLSEELQAAAESAIDKMIDGNVRGADGNWTREAEEAFASGFERYLRDGSAPSEQLKSTFEKFKEWLTEIYQNIVGTPLEKNVSPELRGVFNSMLQSGESAGRIQRAGAKAVHLASDAIRRTPDAARDARTKLSQAFDRRVRNRVTSQVQQGARVATDAEDALLNEYRGAFVPILDEMDAIHHDIGTTIDADKWARDTSNQIRYALETRNSIIDDARLQKIGERLHEPLRQFKEYQNVLLKQAQEAGLNVTELQDEMIDYLHRQASERNLEWMKANGVDSVRGGSGAETGAGVGRRSQLLKDGYSEAFDEVLADPKAHGMLDDAHPLRETDPEAYDEAIEKIAERLEQVAGERILKTMKKVDDDGKFVMKDLETGFETSIGAKELGELKPDTQILAGDKVQWTAGGAWQFAEPQVVKEIVQHDGHSFVTFEGQTAGAPLGQVNHWDDIAGDTRPTSSTRMGRTVTEKMRGADGKVLKDADGNARTEQMFKSFEHVIEDRFNALARHMHDRPIYLETGGLYTSPLHAMHTGARAVISGMTNARLTTETLVEGFRSGILEMPFTGRGETMTLDKLFDNSALSAMDRRKAYQKIVDGNQDRFGDDWVEQMQKGGRGGMFEAEGGEGLQILKGKQPAGPVGANLDDSEFFKHVGRIQIDKEFADDITRAWEFQKADSTGLGKSVNDNFRSFTAMFKAGVLNSPQRFTRDGVSGQIKNMTHGIFSGTAFKSMFNVLFNRPDKFLQELPQVQDYMKARKWDDTPENATKAVRQMYAARRGHSSSIYHDLDQTDDALDASQDFEQLRETLLGRHSGLWDLLKDITATAVGRRGGTFDPRDVAGVHWGNDGVRRAESKLAPVQAGELTGRYMDDSNRLVGFIESMRKGVSADEAMKIVDDVQLNYDPRTFTPTEQMLKKFFPFYSFFTREVKYLSNELITNPAGRLGKLIRLQAAGARRVEDEDGNYIPEHARTQMSIPVGRSEDGGTTYFSGLGLMHDDPVEKLMTLAIDPMAGVRKGLSQLNPLVKGPLESAMGVSTFQGGPLGGRDLSDMDPTIGRILTNLGLQDPTPSGRAAPVMGQRWIENMAANSPAARILSNIKTAGDDRKSAAQRLMNLSTGMRFTTVSPHQSRAALRDLSDSILKEAGARKFSTYTPPTDEALAEIEKTNPEAAMKLRAIRRNRELVNQERRANIRRNEMQAVQQSIDSGQMPAMTKTQQQRYDRWVKNFGTETSPSQWTQYVYQRKADGTAQRSGIKDWAPTK